ncbi:MAG: LamG domain-containing protein, partial [Aestuariibacter sp.]|nr:LamG domain-containing protein [Aestuariibacter sp.]
MINSSSDSFDGQMDEIMIFDRALFEHEVYNLAQSTLAAIASVETSFELLGDGSYLVDLPLPDGAKFYLPFNENRVDEAGDRITSFADYSGTGQSAGCVLSRCPDADAEGQDGSGLFFDRFDNFLSITTNLIDPGADQFTAAAWFNVDEIGVGDQVILSQANIAGNGTGQNWLGIRDNGVPYTFLDGNFLQGTEVISTGQWHHVAVMYDGAMLSLYVNGQLAATSASTLVSSDGELRIGVSNTGGNYFGGGIDELALFDRALALSELRQLMTDGRSILTVDFDEAYAVNGDVLTLNSVLPLTAQLVSDGSSNLIALGQVGSGALTLDGNGDYTAVSSSPFLDLSHGEYSQLVWIYPEPTDNNTYPIISSGASSSVAESYPFIELVEQTKLRVGFGDGTSMTSFTTDSVLTANAWNQVGVTFDGDTMRIFVNGVEVTSTTTLSGLAPYPTQQFDIGRDDNGFFKGQIDDVQIYQRPLTA